MRSSTDKSLVRAKEEIFDAIRFLAPHEAEQILRELAQDMKVLSDKYDQILQDAILS